jgi:hypothetical protein
LFAVRVCLASISEKNDFDRIVIKTVKTESAAATQRLVIRMRRERKNPFVCEFSGAERNEPLFLCSRMKRGASTG